MENKREDRGEESDVPIDKDDLFAQAALLICKLKVVHGPAALSFWQISEKFIVVARRRRFQWDNFGLAVVEFEDDVLVLLLEFQFFEHAQTV